MMTKDNGGPAYPKINSSNGMTLRDYFAARVDVSGIVFPDFKTAAEYIGEPMPDETCFTSKLDFANKVDAFIRYKKADAMLEARK